MDIDAALAVVAQRLAGLPALSGPVLALPLEASGGEAFVPLVFAPGEAYQFDWAHEVVVLGGVTTTVKASEFTCPMVDANSFLKRLEQAYISKSDVSSRPPEL